MTLQHGSRQGPGVASLDMMNGVGFRVYGACTTHLGLGGSRKLHVRAV